MTTPFPGAWRENSNQGIAGSRDGLRLFTETHFCFVSTQTGRSPAATEPTDEQAAVLFHTLVALAGTHVLTEKSGVWARVRRVQFHARPDAVGREAKNIWTFEDGRAHEQFVQAGGALGAPIISEKVSEAGVSPFAGAWELVSDAYEGLVIRTDSHYAALVTRRDRPVPQGAELSEAEAAGLFRATQTAVAGVYTFEGMRTTTRTLLDRNPAAIGRESTREWRFENDRCIGVPLGGGEQVVWRKVG